MWVRTSRTARQAVTTRSHLPLAQSPLSSTQWLLRSSSSSLTPHRQPPRRHMATTPRQLASTSPTAASTTPSPTTPHNGIMPLYNPTFQPIHFFEPEPSVRKATRTSTQGLSGDPEEILPLFHACIQVHKLDRAADILQRLATVDSISSDRLVPLHDIYLEASLQQLRALPNQDQADQLHHWFETKIIQPGFIPTPTTMACMLKVALQHEPEAKRKEAFVNRYLALAIAVSHNPNNVALETDGDAAAQAQNEDEKLAYFFHSSSAILTEDDWAEMTNLCPHYQYLDTAKIDALYQADMDLNLETDSTSSILEAQQSEFDESLLMQDFSYTDNLIQELAQQSEQERADDTHPPPSPSLETSPPSPSPTPTEEGAAFPQVLSTRQKGLGLSTLKQTLSLFQSLPKDCDFSQLTLDQRREIQSRLEHDSITSAMERWRNENQNMQAMGRGGATSQVTMGSLLYDWQVMMEARVVADLEKVEESEANPRKTTEDIERCVYGPILRQGKTERLVAVTILTTLGQVQSLGADRGCPVSSVISAVGRAVEEDIHAYRTSLSKKRFQQALALRKPQFVTALKALEADPNNAEAQRIVDEGREAIPKLIETFRVRRTMWPSHLRVKIGAFFLHHLLDTARTKVIREDPDTKTLVSQLQPAFSTVVQIRRGHRTGVLCLNSDLVDRLKSEPRADFLTKHLPMVVEPRPWTSYDRGGYLDYKSVLMRASTSDKDQRLYATAALERNDMHLVLKGLNILGQTAWRINKPVLKVMLDAWNTGKPIAGLPPLNPELDVPPEPENMEDPMIRRAWLRAVKEVENEKSGYHSQRCFINFQLEIARAFRNQVFYFPHNMDFRGRAYPLPTYLNHMGADHVRGLLRFAEARRVGVRGLQWIKVHLANVFGFDKASLSERERFADERMEDILDSANHPLDGKGWWRTAEDPWQCLATCMELRNAYQLEDPAEYVSSLPVHQDGTCNGLQHYAALGGDEWGARQVNLEPGDRPSDVYSAVANLVKEAIAVDAQNDHPFAKCLDGKITRKVVKQTVMTNVYGVTYIGARRQVQKQLDDLFPNLEKESGHSSSQHASYIAMLIFKALSSIFRGAHEIQTWLGEVGGRICTSLNREQVQRIVDGLEENNVAHSDVSQQDTPVKRKKSGGSRKSDPSTGKPKKTTSDSIQDQFRSTIVWTTPLSMPVVQPYRKEASRLITTKVMDMNVPMPSRSDPVSRRKQLQAFPPNFIHSLDASHMILSATGCHEKGLTFAAVHDSFWTHACDVDTMNEVLRHSFIQIHQEDIIERLAREFETRYRGSMYLARVDATSAAGREIKAFRKSRPKAGWKQTELVLEHQRQKLLRSEDETEREQGRAMVTPASLYEQYAQGQADMVLQEGVEETGLGRVASVPSALEENAEETLFSAADAAGEVLKEEGEDGEEAAMAEVSFDLKSNLQMRDTASEIEHREALQHLVNRPSGLSLFANKLNQYRGESLDLVDTYERLRERDGLEEADAAAAAAAAAGSTSATANEFQPKGNPAEEAKAKTKKKDKAKAKAKPVVEVWMPLSIPPLPKRGDFDVNRLRDSQYFFS